MGNEGMGIRFGGWIFGLSMLLIACAVLPGELYAQRNSRSKTDSPQIGDIILYSDISGDEEYALVINIGRTKMDIEKISRRGDIDSTFVIATGRFKWELIHRISTKSKRSIRKWKTSDGKFEIKAKLLRVEDGKVRLEKENGKTILVPLKKLSPRDQEYVEKGSTSGDGAGSENPFAAEESDDFPKEVLKLMERRRELMQRDVRHQRLAKLTSNLMIGDIIEFEGFRNETQFGIVVSLGNRGKVEVVGDDGELEEARGFSRSSRWTFYDREMVAPALSVRTWSSSSGKFKIKATLTKVNDDKVLLAKEEGGTVELPLSKLSEMDRKYAKRVGPSLNVRQDEQLIAERENYGFRLQQLLERRKQVVKRAMSDMVVAKESAKMKGIRLKVGPMKVSGVKPAASADDAFKLSFPLRMPENSRVEKVFYARESGMVALAAGSPFRGKPTLAVVNVDSQDVFTNIDSDDVGHDGEVVAFSPSGKRILLYTGNGFDAQLELWSFEDGLLDQLNVITYDSFHAPQAHLFSDEHGAIMSSDGQLTFIDTAERIKPTHQISVGHFGGRRGFQVAGNAVFVLNDSASTMYAIDATTKKCIGGMNFETEGGSSLFSFAQVNPDGKTVVFVESSRFSVYDLATGERVTTRELPGRMNAITSSAEKFQYLGTDLALLSDNSLYDLVLGIEIGSVKSGFAFNANYNPDGSRIVASTNRSGRSSFGGRGMLGASRRGSRAERRAEIDSMRNEGNYKVVQTEVSVQRLPVDEIIAHARSLKESDIVDFGDGDSVSVSIKIDGGERVANNLRNLIEDTMDEGGIRVERGSDFVFELSYTVGEQQTENFRIHGFGPPRDRQATMTPKTCRAVLKYKGEVIWSRSRSVSLNRVADEEDLNRILKLAKEMRPEMLMDFKYPVEVRVLQPSKREDFSWR